MVNVDGSKRIWKQPEIKDIFEKCGAKKPDKATWGDVQYVFAMYYSDGFRDFNVSGFYFNSYCFILNLINS